MTGSPPRPDLPDSWALALRFALRELRGGFRGLGVLALCLGLGVAAIAGVGSLTDAVDSAIERDAQGLLGGDLLVSITHRPADPQERAALAARGTLSETIEMRALARGGPEDRRTLVELKALDSAYPLYGTIALSPDLPLAEALAEKDGVHGAVVEKAVLARLGIAPGARITVGDATLEVRAAFETLPDRGVSAFGLGPRLAIDPAALQATGLVQPGSLVTYEYRLRLAPGRSPSRIGRDLNAEFPQAGWNIRTAREAAPGLRRQVERLGLFLSLVGLSALLVAVALIEGNIARQVREEIPSQAPSFFFIDIQPDQIEPFLALARETKGVTALDSMPSLRGRITRVNGVPVEQAAIAPGSRWATASDRGLTYAAAMPADYRLAAGQWWPQDYRGEAAISLDARIAAGMGLGVGDSLTVNVLGRDITARIMSLREVNWQSFGLNFTIVFAPGVLEGAPHTYIATAYSDHAAEEPLFRAISDRFANVTAIRVRDALDAISAIIGDIALTIRATASITLAAGLLVLASAVATGRHHRIRDAVILKVLGATRRNMLGAFLIEYGLIGVLTALIAVAVGTLASWAVVVVVMRSTWTFLPAPAIEIALLSLAATLVFGFAGTFQALGRKAAPYLRNP